MITVPPMAFVWSRLAIAALVAGAAAAPATARRAAAASHERTASLVCSSCAHARVVARGHDLAQVAIAPPAVAIALRPPRIAASDAWLPAEAPAPAAVLPSAPKTSPPIR